MAKIKVEISGDTVLILSRVTFDPKSGKICIHTKGNRNPNRNIAVVKGEKASWEFNTGEGGEGIGNKPILKINVEKIPFTYSEHDECVKILLDAGEKILQPKGDPHDHILAYLKNEHPPRHYGHIRKGKDGTFEMLYHINSPHLKNIKLSELGLCDAMVWEENKDAIHSEADIKKLEEKRGKPG